MRLLLDECMPRRLKREFVGHEVKTAREAGFAGLKNGALLRAADASFDVLITVDRNCLLYTSPSPRDRQKSRMPSSA